jgi:hypothetical protein
VTLVLDSGAFIALERKDRAMWRRFKAALLAEQVPVTHGGIVGQVWRGRGSRQALLSMTLDSVEVRPLDDSLGRASGALLAAARGNDVLDAALVLLAADGDRIVTSDPDDIRRLAAAAGRHVELIRAAGSS